jgi:hypothetical protein
MPRFKPPALPIPKLPAIPSSASSFLWAFGLGLYIFLAGMAVGFAPEPVLIVSVVAGCAIFVFVRLYGEDDPNRP